jgi:hypothetical protein
MFVWKRATNALTPLIAELLFSHDLFDTAGMLTVLNLAIGITFIYLLFSFVVSALNEFWLTYLDKRADFLKQGLEQLLQDPEKVRQVLEHGLVDALSRSTNGTPSYIDVEAFTAAVLDVVKPADPNRIRNISDFQTAIAALPDSKLKQSLAAILDSAENDLASFKKGIAHWYQRSMERVSGWYKRYAQKWLLGLALGLAVVCNVDTIHVIRVLSSSPQVLAETVTQAVNTVKAATPQMSASSGSAQPTESAPNPTQDTTQAMSRLVNNANVALSNLSSLSVPIGWSELQWQYLRDPGHLVSAFLGWFLTGLAASLGAPFWFDTLQRFVNVRGNGRSPEESDFGTKETTTV